MRMKRLRLSNFTSFKEESISVDSITAFVGPNGAGKSNVLKALDFALNPDYMRRNDALTKYSYWIGIQDVAAEVTVTFGELTEEEATFWGTENLEPGDTEANIIESAEDAAVLDENPLHLRITTATRFDPDNDEHSLVTYFTKYGREAIVSRRQKASIGFTYLKGDQMPQIGR